MHVVPRPERRFLGYPDSVWRALASIRAATRAAHSAEEEKLNPNERPQLAEAVRVTRDLGQIVEAHLDAIDRGHAD